MSEKSTSVKSTWIKRIVLGLVLLVLVFAGLCTGRKIQFARIKEARSLTAEEMVLLGQELAKSYPERYEILKTLPYKINTNYLNVYARSAILIDVATGDILYSKNPDEVIPPASMTKLFAMYVVDEEVRKGNLSYNQEIPLPPEVWACNMPPHSSLMFLGKGQKVTLEELLLGLSICSGNDAAYALAYAVCGNMEDFVERMNKVAKDLGLVHTYFEESSGYSENNTTTAREMAAFARVYLQRHPESLKKFHGVKDFTYPKEQNMAPGDHLQTQDWSQGLPEKITMPITQKNTNPLLGYLEGCDGLKTGYIDESGYNLSLTAIRKGTRFLSVTMGGPGKSTAEGQQNRIHDGSELMEWAFGSFSNYYSNNLSKKYLVKCYGTKEKSMQLVPAGYILDQYALLPAFCVPYITGASQEENLAALEIEINIPEYIFGPVEAGKEYGQLKIKLNGHVLDTIPLVADRSSKKANGLLCLVDKIIK